MESDEKNNHVFHLFHIKILKNVNNILGYIENKPLLLKV